jgi:pilus assembly protein CpaC
MHAILSIARPLAAAMALSAAAGAIPASTPTAAAQRAGSPTLVQVNTGRGRLITLSRPMTDLFVADPGVADVQVRSATQLYVFGKKTGETTVSATDKAGRVVFAATVRIGNNFDSVGSMLTLAMPEARITTTPMNGMILLTGTVAAPEDAAEAERLVQAYVGKETQVLSRLKTATPLQVNLQVRIAEVSRTFLKNVGVNLTNRDETGGFNFGIASGRSPGRLTEADLTGYPIAEIPIPGGGFIRGPFDVTSGRIIDPRGVSTSTIQQGAARTTLGLAGRLLGLDLLAAIDLGESIGQVSTLANPNLTALSGETATFLAGGEIPIPISQALGTVSIEYRQYGVSLAYTPTVLSDGRISLRVRPEVSQLTSEGAVQINGTTIPGLSTRRAETTLELGSGQSMMIGGLIQNSHNNTVDRTPGLGALPVLGALFKSNGFRKSETELVIIITPYLVRPVDNPGDIKLPTDGYRSATDLEQIFLGKTQSSQPGGPRPVPTMAPPSSTPSIGAAAPVPMTPAPAAPRRKPKASRKGGSGIAPGFNN